MEARDASTLPWVSVHSATRVWKLVAAEPRQLACSSSRPRFMAWTSALIRSTVA